jgi:hypothetical protein
MATTCAPPPQSASASASAVRRLVEEAAVIYVAGKGGSGKTTVAGALGLAAARAGRRTIVCDLSGADRLSAGFGVACEPGREAPLAPRLWYLGLDPDEALREWLRRQPGGPVAATVLGRSQAFAHLVAAAPGAKEVITLGKVLDLAGRAPTPAEGVPYDLVIADAASTGHAIGMVAAPATIAESVPVGAVGEQARALRETLRDPAVTAYVGTTLPEPMSTREVLELDHGLRAAVGRGLDVIVVDGVWPDRLADEELDRVRAVAGEYPLARAALIVDHRARRHAAEVRELREQARCPVVTLPYVFASRLGRADYDRFARTLYGRIDAPVAA